MALSEIMLAMVLREDPASAKNAARLDAWRAQVTVTEALTRKVGSQGLLVSPEVDPVILDAISWYEGRFRQRPADGDCTWSSGTIAHPTPPKFVCDAVGTMQIAKATLPLILRLPEATLVGLPKKLSVQEARDPETSVQLAYAVLASKKRSCSGLPGSWITAFGWGRCAPRGYVDREGTRRCALATALLEATGTKPPDWTCGHEKKKLARQEQALVRFVKKQENRTHAPQ